MFGRRAGETAVAPRAGELGSSRPRTISSFAESIKGRVASSSSSGAVPHLVAEPLTTAGFAPYGQVIQAFPSPDLAPASVKRTSANGGSAWKYHRLSVPESSYPAGSGEVQAISCFRAVPPKGFGGKGWKGTFESRMFERHSFTTRCVPSSRRSTSHLQAVALTLLALPAHAETFIPMGKSDNELEHGGEGMLIIVAQNGKGAPVNSSLEPRAISVADLVACCSLAAQTTRPTPQPTRRSSRRPRRASPTRRASGVRLRSAARSRPPLASRADPTALPSSAPADHSVLTLCVHLGPSCHAQVLLVGADPPTTPLAAFRPTLHASRRRCRLTAATTSTTARSGGSPGATRPS